MKALLSKKTLVALSLVGGILAGSAYASIWDGMTLNQCLRTCAGNCHNDGGVDSNGYSTYKCMEIMR